MKKEIKMDITKKIIVFLIFSLVILPVVQAHQPKLVYNKANVQENIKNPETSQAFYGELKGKSDYYFINSEKDFELYINILSPEIEEARKDFSVKIISNNFNNTLQGNDWEVFHEEFAGDNYWMGPELDKNVSAGNYYIEVSNQNNTGRYVLAVGKIESFPLGESLKSIISILRLKHDFFNKSYFDFFSGRIGKAVGIFLFILIIIIVGLVFLLKKLKKQNQSKIQ